MDFLLVLQSVKDFIDPFISDYIFLTALVVVLILRTLYQNRNLPPGPWGLPIFGCFHLFLLLSLKKFTEMSKKYGNVMSFYLGKNLVIVLGDYEAAKEAYVKHGAVFSGRPYDFLFKISDDDRGLITNEGEEWQTHRRFALSVFREYGMGKMSLEPKIQEEIRCCLEEFAKSGGKPINPKNLLGISVANNIAVMAFGKRYQYSDKDFQQLFGMVEHMQKLLHPLMLKSFVPLVNFLPFSDKLTKHSLLLKYRAIMDGFLRKQVKSHEEKYEDGNRNDYIDAYLTHKKELLRSNGNEGYFNQANLEGNLLQLFAAGTDTVTTTLQWCLLYMALYPDIQKRVQNEIEDVVGVARLPSMNDKSQMPFTEATLMEISRCATVAPFNVVHCNVEEFYLFGMRIPKRTQILVNLYAIHHDPRHWELPDTFNPLRFLDDNGHVKKSDFLIPFSLGKRSCIGESLARMELFLFFTSMLQRFSITAPPEEHLSSTNYTIEIVRSPRPYKICAIQRKNYEVL